MKERSKQLTLFAGAMFFVASLCSIMEFIYVSRELKLIIERDSAMVGTAESIVFVGYIILLLQAASFLVMGYTVMSGRTVLYGVFSIITGVGFLVNYSIIVFGHWYSSGGYWWDMYVRQYGFWAFYISMVLLALSFVISGIAALAGKKPVISISAAALYLAGILMFGVFFMMHVAKDPISFYHIFVLLPRWIAVAQLAAPCVGLVLTAMAYSKESKGTDE